MNKKLSIELSPELHKRLKQVAAEEETTIRALILEAAESILKKREDEKREG